MQKKIEIFNICVNHIKSLKYWRIAVFYDVPFCSRYLRMYIDSKIMTKQVLSLNCSLCLGKVISCERMKKKIVLSFENYFIKLHQAK